MTAWRAGAADGGTSAAVCVPGRLHGRVSTLDACRYPPGVTEIGGLHSEGALRFGTNSCYRWVLHRPWIAAGNEALACAQADEQPVRADRT